MIYQLRLTGDLSDNNNKGRFYPFVLQDPVPSRSWAKSDDDGETWHPIHGNRYEPDDSPDHLGAPTPAIGDDIRILIGTPADRAEHVHLYTIFSRASDSDIRSGASPFETDEGRRQCVITHSGPEKTFEEFGFKWWQFHLGHVAVLDDAINHHFEMSVGAKIKVRGEEGTHWEYGHDPEMVVDSTMTVAAPPLN